MNYSDRQKELANVTVDYHSEKAKIAQWAEDTRIEIHQSIGEHIAEATSAMTRIREMTSDYYASAEQQFRAEVQRIFQP